MPKATHIFTNFTAGELSPRLYGRVDLAKYNNGCKYLLNFLLHPHGGISKRGGTKFLAKAKYADKECRLLKFEYSVTQAYSLEIGENYIRYYYGQARAESGDTAITAITVAAAAVVSQVGHYLSVGDVVCFEDALGMTEINSVVGTVTAVTADTFTTDINSSAFTAYTSGAVAIVETVTTYTEDELFDLDFAQSADTLYIAHKNHVPATLTRSGHWTWTLANIWFTWASVAITNVTQANPGVVTSAAHGLSDLDYVWITTIVGMTELNSAWYYIRNATTDTFSLSTTKTGALVDTSGYTAYSSGGLVRAAGWSPSDYPQSVCFFEQRCIYAGTISRPQTIWGSVSGDYDNMDVGLGAADDSWSYTLASEDVNAIVWLSPGEELVVGTVGGEFTASGSSGDPITPTNIRISRRSTYGSAGVSPIRVSDVALYVQRAKRKIRQFGYQFETDSFVSPDLTLLSEHITRGNVKQMTYHQEPHSMLWVALEDGELCSLTYQRDQEVVGWGRQQLGGTSDAAGSLAKVESLCSLPGTSGSGFDEVYFAVQRWIDGAAVRHIEVLQEGLDDESTIDTAYFLDCGLSGTITGTTIAGLDHLEGETVDILIDGATHPSEVVSGGQVTLDYAVTDALCHVGYGYNADLETIGVEAGSADGSAQGKTKRVSEITIRVYRTVGLRAGGSSDTLDEILFRVPANPMDEAVPLFTGDKRIPPKSGYDTEGSVYLRQPYALPCEITAVVLKIMVND